MAIKYHNPRQLVKAECTLPASKCLDTPLRLEMTGYGLSPWGLPGLEPQQMGALLYSLWRLSWSLHPVPAP